MGADSRKKLISFGRYQLLEKIAVGGMAEIYRAKVKGEVGFEKQVAIKRILPHLSEDQSFMDMLIKEAKLASLLNHVNIGQVYDLGKVGKHYFIAMEYVQGPDLRSMMKRCSELKEPIPEDCTLFIICRKI